MAFKNWRLNWFYDQVSGNNHDRKHRDVLKSPSKFWLTLFAKFVPGIFNNSVQLDMKEGGGFVVRDFMTLYIYNEIFVERCYDYPQLQVKSPVILDIGANTGLFTLRMKQLYPGSNVFCFEPFPPNFKDLKQNIEHSALVGVQIYQNAVGRDDRNDRLFINKSNVGGHSFHISEAQSDDYVDINVLSLRSVMNKVVGTIDLMKLDCEGAEHEILMSVDQEMASRIRYIVFESTDSVYNVDEVIEHLTQFGFSVKPVEKTVNFLATNINFTV